MCEWLGKKGWKNIQKSKNHSHGIDIKADRGTEILIIEAKGSYGNPESPVTTRGKFDSGQIKDHFGKALVKVLEERYKNPTATVAIAHPNDEYIKKCLQNVISEVKKLGIKLYWVESTEDIIEE